MTEVRTVSDLREAANLLEFVDVTVYESRGQRRDGGFGDLVEDSTDDEGKGQLQIEILISDGPEVLAVRAQSTTTSADVVVSYDAAAVYRKAEPIALDPATSRAFITNIAIMTLYPFLREGVHEVSSRLGFPIKLSMLRAADVGLQIANGAADSAAAASPIQGGELGQSSKLDRVGNAQITEGPATPARKAPARAKARVAAKGGAAAAKTSAGPRAAKK
jgi:hypothetical protein